MTPRNTNFQARKDRILAITVGQYIATVSPVSSHLITQTFPLDLSSATIRNILAELEEEGYLTHPHTSAGRVPTQKGYRYYVDHLMHEIHLLEEEKARIKSAYERESLELEQLLEKTSRVLAETTHYTSIISVDGWEDKIFCGGRSFVVGYPEYQDIEKIRNILVTLDEKERLLEMISQNLQKKIETFIGQEMACADMQHCSLVISQYTTKSGPSGRIAVLGPTRMHYERVIPAVDYFSRLIAEII